MTSPITFKSATAQANTILRNDKAKLEWSKLPISDLPKDIQAMVVEAIELEIASRNAMSRVQMALDEKVNAPVGKRLIVTLGRSVHEQLDSILVAWANATSSGTRVVSFDQFVKG